VLRLVDGLLLNTIGESCRAGSRVGDVVRGHDCLCKNVGTEVMKMVGNARPGNDVLWVRSIVPLE
jgi:hypothetical protein